MRWRQLFLAVRLASCSVLRTVLVNDQEIDIVVEAGDDLLATGAEFCAKYGIDDGAVLRDGRPRCATLIADDLADSLYCNASSPSGAFRFYHGTYFFDSEEYELLRELLLRLGHVECLSGEKIGGGENVVWVLGHFSDESEFYDSISGQMVNAIPSPIELGNKDRLYENLVKLSEHIGDAALNFVPRTWLAEELRAMEHDEDVIGGLWLRKDPTIELGGGIKLARLWSEMKECETCLLQRYVQDPFLLTDADAGVLDAKFSFGVYFTVQSVRPLIAWLHREMLVLLCNEPYGEQDGILSHLTNGLLNQRIAGDGYDASERVWTTDRLLAYFKDRGIDWRMIEDQIRSVAAKALLSVRAHMLLNDKKQELFSHWRLDFLLDKDLKVWLLEVEIVPSAGTIGGVDEVLKTTVLRDLLALTGAGPALRPKKYPWLEGECWVDTKSKAKHPNRVCATPDVKAEMYETAKVDLPPGLSVVADEIAALEGQRRRSGGYRPLFPLPRNFRYFDGQQGSTKEETRDMWRTLGATPEDLALDVWDQVRTKGSREEDAHFKEYFEADCRACDGAYCATFSHFENEPMLLGKCGVSKCLYAPSGLVDGVAINTEAECALLDTVGGLASLLKKAKVHTLQRHAPALARWCNVQLRRASYDEDNSDLTTVCDSSVPFNGILEGGQEALREAQRANEPLVVRGAVTASWSPSAMIAEAGDTEVHAMVFNGTKDRAQPIQAAKLTLKEFFEQQSQLTSYVLLTDRHRVEGVPAAVSLADPNAALMSKEGPLPRLHAALNRHLDEKLLLEPFETVWTSLRLTAGEYRYPTHVDCYDNVIIQLHGAKNVTVFPPSAAKFLRPDVRMKHWPRGSELEMQKAIAKSITIQLEPGDLLFVPLMWPHNVHAGSASITANRYFALPDTNEWIHHTDKTKHNAWLAFEIDQKERLCG